VRSAQLLSRALLPTSTSYCARTSLHRAAAGPAASRLMVALLAALLLLLLAAVAVSAAPRRPAAVPTDCSLNGEYVAGRCQCDPMWAGPDCSLLSPE
jgi:uncharacterized protein (DUF58 family)